MRDKGVTVSSPGLQVLIFWRQLLCRLAVAMELWRVPISRGLLDLVLLRMADGTEWCAPGMSGGEQPLKCTMRSLLERRLGDRAVPESWTTTVPLKGVLHLLSDAEQARLKLTPKRRVQGTLFLVSMEALSELLHHTPRVKAWAAGRTFSTIAELRTQAANPPAAAVRDMCCALVRVGAVPGLWGGCTGRGSAAVAAWA